MPVPKTGAGANGEGSGDCLNVFFTMAYLQGRKHWRSCLSSCVTWGLPLASGAIHCLERGSALQATNGSGGEREELHYISSAALSVSPPPCRNTAYSTPPSPEKTHSILLYGYTRPNMQSHVSLNALKYRKRGYKTDIDSP